MAAVVLVGEYLAINGTDVSAYLKGATCETEVADKDATTMGSGGWHVRAAGLKDGSLKVELLDDFAAGLLDAIMWPLFGTIVTFELRATQSAVGVSNPKYTGSMLIKQHQAGGSLDDLAMKSVTYPTSGVVSRATA